MMKRLRVCDSVTVAGTERHIIEDRMPGVALELQADGVVVLFDYQGNKHAMLVPMSNVRSWEQIESATAPAFGVVNEPAPQPQPSKKGKR